MTQENLKEIALELVSVIRGYSDIYALKAQMGGRSVLIRDSTLESGRTIELQLLEQSDYEIQLSAFSDGPQGSIGVTAHYDSFGMKIISGPKSFKNGVPVNDIDI